MTKFIRNFWEKKAFWKFWTSFIKEFVSLIFNRTSFLLFNRTSSIYKTYTKIIILFLEPAFLDLPPLGFLFYLYDLQIINETEAQARFASFVTNRLFSTGDKNSIYTIHYFPNGEKNSIHIDKFGGFSQAIIETLIPTNFIFDGQTYNPVFPPQDRVFYRNFWQSRFLEFSRICMYFLLFRYIHFILFVTLPEDVCLTLGECMALSTAFKNSDTSRTQIFYKLIESYTKHSTTQLEEKVIKAEFEKNNSFW